MGIFPDCGSLDIGKLAQGWRYLAAVITAVAVWSKPLRVCRHPRLTLKSELYSMPMRPRRIAKRVRSELFRQFSFSRRRPR